MKFSVFLIFVCLSPLLVFGQAKTIKSAEISFVFVSKDVDGHISGFDSSSSIDFENPTNSKLKGSVAVKTIKTGIFLRDWSLKGGKYFDADDHPRIFFESNSIAPTADGFSVKGILTIKGNEKPITIDFKKQENQLIGTTTLFSSDFGINIKKKREDNEVQVKMTFDLN